MNPLGCLLQRGPFVKGKYAAKAAAQFQDALKSFETSGKLVRVNNYSLLSSSVFSHTHTHTKQNQVHTVNDWEASF